MKETNIIFGKKSFAHKKIKIFLYMLFMGTFLTACGKAEEGNQVTEAVYLGVENYGAEEVNKDTPTSHPQYLFRLEPGDTRYLYGTLWLEGTETFLQDQADGGSIDLSLSFRTVDA